MRYRELLFFLALIIFIILSYNYLDIPTAVYFHNLSYAENTLFYYLSFLGQTEINLTIWTAIYFYLRFIRKNSLIANKLLLIIISISLSNIVIVPIKIIFGRARPELLFSENLYGFQYFEFANKELSFPSGHAIVFAAIMGSLVCLYPRHRYAFIPLAFLLSFVRVAVTAHYLSDILASIGIGFAIAYLTYKCMRKEINFKGETHGRAT